MVKKKSPFLKLLVLALLITKGSMHGYAIYKEIIVHTKEKWRPSIGTIYRVLNEMYREGFLEKNVLKTSGRRVVQYTITDRGVQTFIDTSKHLLPKMSTILATFIEAYKVVSEKKDWKPGDELVNKLSRLSKVIGEYLSKQKST